MIKRTKSTQTKINVTISKDDNETEVSYIKIDKKVLNKGSSLNFDIFAHDKQTQMSLFLQSDSVIDLKKREALHNIEELFVRKSDKNRYDCFLEEHIQNIVEDNSLSLDEKTDIIYESTSELTHSLYQNPDGLKNVKRSQNIVDPLLETILSNDDTILSYIKIIAYDYYTHTHSLNVSIYALCLGAEMKMSKKDLSDLGRAALLHDLGKSKVDINIVNKTGFLTDEEFTLMKDHPSNGYNSAIHIGEVNKNVLDGIRHHHEKLDGHGYPDGLHGDEITLFPRLIAVCDVFDALTTKRSYKEAMRSFDALILMKTKMDTHLDMKILETFIKMLHK